MYIIKNERNQYLTREGWTPDPNRVVLGTLELTNTLPFTKREAELNSLPKGQSYVRYPDLKWMQIHRMRRV